MVGRRLRRRRRGARRARARSGARARCRPPAARRAGRRRRRRRPCSSSRASPSRSTSSQRAGHAVAGEEVAQVVRVLGEAVADDAHAAGLERRARLPGRQQVLDDREELLLRRVPGLEQVVVQRDLVDRLDRRLRVRVGGQQHALGVGHELARLRRGTRSPPSRACAGRPPAARPARRGATSSRSSLQRLGARAGAHDRGSARRSRGAGRARPRPGPPARRRRPRSPGGDDARSMPPTGSGRCRWPCVRRYLTRPARPPVPGRRTAATPVTPRRRGPCRPRRPRPRRGRRRCARAGSGAAGAGSARRRRRPRRRPRRAARTRRRGHRVDEDEAQHEVRRHEARARRARRPGRASA